MKNLVIRGNSDTVEKVLEIKTDNDSVLIGELIASIDKDGGGEYETIIATSAISVTGVSLDQTSLALKEDESATLTATITPEDATNKGVEWSSADETVVTVSDGKFITIKEGKTTITATTEDGGYTSTCEITVTKGTTSTTNSKDRISTAVSAAINTGIVQPDITLYSAIGLALVGVILCGAYIVYLRCRRGQ